MSGATGNPQWHEGQIAQNPSNTARRNPKPDKHHVESRDNLVEISEESRIAQRLPREGSPSGTTDLRSHQVFLCCSDGSVTTLRVNSYGRGHPGRIGLSIMDWNRKRKRGIARPHGRAS